MENSARQSYQRIFRSSSIMGLVSLVEMTAGLVRTKCAALFVGVQGVGLLANLTSIQGVVGSFASWGIPMSGMREVALAQAKGDPVDLAQKAHAMLRWCWVSATGGAVLILLFASMLSNWVLGDDSHTRDVLWLVPVVFCGRLAAGYTSVLQSMNRIRYLAQATTINAIGASALAAILYWYLGMPGVALSMVGSFLLQVVVCRWFYRRLRLPQVKQTWQQTRVLGGPMLKLGAAFMWNGLLLCLVGFCTNAMLTRYGGLGAVGIFNAALSLSTVLVNFVLNSMGVDYSPRLTSLSNDKPAMSTLVNQQMELGILISLPLIGFAMVFSELLIHALFSRDFVAATDILRWLLLGSLLKVVGWCSGYVIVALGRGRLHILTETTINLLYLSVAYVLCQFWGGLGIAWAYLGINAFSAVVYFVVANRLAGLRLSSSTNQLLLSMLLGALILMLLVSTAPAMLAMVIGFLIWCVLALLCLRSLVQRVGAEHSFLRFLFAAPVLGAMLTKLMIVKKD